MLTQGKTEGRPHDIEFGDTILEPAVVRAVETDELAVRLTAVERLAPAG